jgi:hypothetical protein
MMLPILISVSDAPVSYFFCAKEGLLVAASNARDAATAPSRKWLMGILVSLDPVSCVLLLWTGTSRPLADIQYLLPPASNKKPPATGSQGASFSVECAA